MTSSSDVVGPNASDQPPGSPAAGRRPLTRPSAPAKRADLPAVSRKKRRLRRVLLGALAATPVLLLGLWIAVHRVEWLGPLIANSLRSVIGKDNVARLEDFAYGVEDKFNRWWRKDEKPKAYWAVPAKPPPASAATGSRAPSEPPFRPKDVGPMNAKWAAPGDGQWIALGDPVQPDDPAMQKTLIHPDPFRSWSEVFVVAVDLSRAELHAMPGYREPTATVADAKKMERPGRIPDRDHALLVAAFNGGFMTEHGEYGMKVGPTTIVLPKPSSCTVARYEDGRLRIGTWKKLAEEEPQMSWFRQAPACMYEDGKMHVGLSVANNRSWGATLDGDTVIRRSGIGLSEDGRTLYVAITNHTTARALADAMHHAGAVQVAQLDVNWSYPKFLTYEAGEGGPDRKAVALAKGFEFDPDEYIRKKSLRDFFYLTRKDAPVH
jgi:hypothetical protein